MRAFASASTAFLFLLSPGIAISQTRAISHEDAIVLAFRRLCIDIFPSVKLLGEMGKNLHWKKVFDPEIISVACAGPRGGFVDQPLMSFVSSDFSFPVKLAVWEYRDAGKTYTTCIVGDENVDGELVVKKMLTDIGADEANKLQGGPTRLRQDWAVGRFDQPYRLTAYRPGEKGITLTLCDDPTGIAKRP